MVEHPVQLVDGVRPKRIAHLGPVEGHPYRGVLDVAVVGDVGEIAEPVDGQAGESLYLQCAVQGVVQDKTWKLVVDSRDEVRLYDLAEDPREKVNRWADPHYAPDKARLLARILDALEPLERRAERICYA